jgi:hypothetical protein
MTMEIEVSKPEQYILRLKTKDEESTLLTYTGLLGELEHLKIETRLIDAALARTR